MKKSNVRNVYRKIFLVGIFALLIGILTPGIHAEAAKAVKVKSQRVYNSEDYSERLVVKGLSSKGKVVWTYKTKYFQATQLEQVACAVHGNRVYVFEGKQVSCLKKTTGKKLWVCKKTSPAGYKYTFDSDNNLYVIGYFDDYVYKISAKGKIVWKKNIQTTGNYWPSKLKCKKGKLTITFDANENDQEMDNAGAHKAVLNMKTGKILSYK